MKLAAALGLVVAAASARVIAAAYAPDRASLSALAIGLNPLFVLEGPGNGHNDLVMVGLMLAGLALSCKKRPLAGFLLLGCSAAIKFVSAAIAPWLLLDVLRFRRPRRALATSLLAGALVVGPTVAAFAPFWAGSRTLEGAGFAYRMSESAVRSDASPATSIPSRIAGLWPLFVVYLGLSGWLWLRPSPGRYLGVWAIFSASVPFLGMPTVFPWYLTWSCSASLTRWDPLHVRISVACLAVAAVLVGLYAVPVAP
jgi:alpha-1,6-mannosyltransferase